MSFKAVRKLLVIIPMLLAFFTLQARTFHTVGISLYSEEWDGLSATDSTWFYLDRNGNPLPAGGGSYPSPQYLASRTNNTANAVFARGMGSITFTYTFYNNSNFPGTIQWSLSGGTFLQTSSSATPAATLTGDYPLTTLAVPPHGTASFSFTLSGLPDIVCYGDVYANLLITGANFASDNGSSGGNSGQSFACHLYETDSTPSGWMATPWADVLNFSCKFADSQTGQSMVGQKCTESLWGCGLFTYDGGGSQWIDDGEDDENDDYVGEYMLSDLVDAFSSQKSAQRADCRDVSSFLQLCFMSQGFSGSLKQLWTGEKAGDGLLNFYTNPICPVGTVGYASTSWQFHQVVEVNGSVYDACAAQQYNLLGALFGDTPYGWFEAGYWQTRSGTTSLGLVLGWLDVPATMGLESDLALLYGPASGSTPILTGVF